MDKMNIEQFNYAALAELFALKDKKYGPITYHRFDTATEGLRYAIESLSPACLKDSFMETGVFRLDAKLMRQLYTAARYPGKRSEVEHGAQPPEHH